MIGSSRSTHLDRWLLPLCAALLANLIVPSAPWAQDGPALSKALVGRQIVVPFDVPIHSYGVDFDGSNDFLRDDESRLKRLDAWGMSFMAGDTATITDVRVGRQRIELILGAGGLSTTTLMALGDPRFQAGGDPALRDDPGPHTLHLDASLKTAREERQSVTNEAGRAAVRAGDALMHRAVDDTTGQGPPPPRLVRAAKVYLPGAGSRLRIHFEQKVPDDMLVPQVLLQRLSEQVIVLGSDE